MKQAITEHIHLTFKASREDQQWVSECLELGTSSCGDTIEAAFDALTDATRVYLQTLEDEGQLDQVFRLRSVKVVAGSPDIDRNQKEVLTATTLPREVVSRHELAIPTRVA